MKDNMIDYINSSHKGIPNLVEENEVSTWITYNHAPYSKKRYERLSKGIHTRTTYDNLISYLVKQGYSGVIEWEN